MKRRKFVMENTYWNRKGAHENLVAALNMRIPVMGEIAGSKNRKLEKFRKASNAYYDIFNNGGCNRMQSISKIFGTDATCHLRYRVSYRSPDWDAISEVVEPKMDAIILDAAKEQGLL
jgi:hypothetical protein